MKKNTFLKKLREELHTLPKDEVEDIIADYNEHFIAGTKRKRTEDAIAQALGDPKQLAKQHKAEYHVNKAKEEKSIRTVSKAVLAVVSLTLFNIIIILGPFIAVVATILSFYIAAIAIIISGIAVLAAGMWAAASLNFVLGIGIIFGSFALICLGILWAIGTGYLSKFVGKATVWYLGLNIKIIKGEKK